jgi:hypothetical protein
MVVREERPVSRTFLTCTWAERQMIPGMPLWLDGLRWCCLARSQQAERRMGVQPERCATCPDWQPRAELVRRSR